MNDITLDHPPRPRHLVASVEATEMRCVNSLLTRLIFLKIFFLNLNPESTTHTFFSFCQFSIRSRVISCWLCSAFVCCWQHNINLRKPDKHPLNAEVRPRRIEFWNPSLTELSFSHEFYPTYRQRQLKLSQLPGHRSTTAIT